jgi:hypothetical protein
MSELPTATADPLHLVDDIDPTPQVEVVLQSAPSLTEAELPPHSSLLTEQEVIFSTAAAVPAQPIRWWTSYLEYSRMEREMHRL